MIFDIGLKKLPFEQNEQDVIYVEKDCDLRMNRYIQLHFDDIYKYFLSQGYRFIYMPRLSKELYDEEVVNRYVALVSASNTKLTSSSILDYMVRPENKNKLQPSLLFYQADYVVNDYPEAECLYSGIQIYDYDYVSTGNFSVFLDEIRDPWNKMTRAKWLTKADRKLIHLLKDIGMSLELTEGVIDTLHKSQMAVEEMVAWTLKNKPNRDELLDKFVELSNAIQKANEQKHQYTKDSYREYLHTKRDVMHVSVEPSLVGQLKMAFKFLGKWNTDMSIPFWYPLDSEGLPQELSEKEMHRISDAARMGLFPENLFDFVNMDFAAFKKIVVWHSWDANSRLLLYFMSKVMDGDLYHVDISKYTDRKLARRLISDEIYFLLDHIELVSKEDRQRYREAYDKLADTEGVPKITDGDNVVCTTKRELKDYILRHISEEPQICLTFLQDIENENEIEISYDYWVMLLIEMIADEEVEVTDIKRRTSNSQTGFLSTCSYKKQYLYKGEDISNWLNFKVHRKKE